MECKKCKKECMESELSNGYCYDCYKKYEYNGTELKNVENTIAKTIKTASNTIKIIGYISSLLVLIVFIISVNFLTGLIAGIVTAFSIFIITILLDGFSEIIQLLEDIKNK